MASKTLRSTRTTRIVDVWLEQEVFSGAHLGLLLSDGTRRTAWLPRNTTPPRLAPTDGGPGLEHLLEELLDWSAPDL